MLFPKFTLVLRLFVESAECVSPGMGCLNQFFCASLPQKVAKSLWVVLLCLENRFFVENLQFTIKSREYPYSHCDSLPKHNKVGILMLRLLPNSYWHNRASLQTNLGSVAKSLHRKPWPWRNRKLIRYISRDLPLRGWKYLPTWRKYKDRKAQGKRYSSVWC